MYILNKENSVHTILEKYRALNLPAVVSINNYYIAACPLIIRSINYKNYFVVLAIAIAKTMNTIRSAIDIAKAMCILSRSEVMQLHIAS